MSTEQTTATIDQQAQAARLEAYQQRADPAIALISSFYLVLLLIPRVAITSYESSVAITVLDVIFWSIITADVAYRVWLSPPGQNRNWLIAGLVLLLSGPFVFLAIGPGTRFLIRIALISVVALRASASIRYFFRLRSIIYIIAAVVLITVVFGVMITVTEQDAKGSNIKSLGTGIWWSVVTVSTVGYGDTYPVTNAGRMIATGLMVFGVAMFSILTATLASAFATRSSADDARQIDELMERLARIEENQQNAQLARRSRSPSRPRRRTPSPRAGGNPNEEASPPQ